MSFHAVDVALELARGVKPILEELKGIDPELRDQLRRAVLSVVLNAAEGGRRKGRDRSQFFRIASGSAAEVHAGLQIAVAWNYVTDDRIRPLSTLIDRELAILWKLQA